MSNDVIPPKERKSQKSKSKDKKAVTGETVKASGEGDGPQDESVQGDEERKERKKRKKERKLKAAEEASTSIDPEAPGESEKKKKKKKKSTESELLAQDGAMAVDSELSSMEKEKKKKKRKRDTEEEKLEGVEHPASEAKKEKKKRRKESPEENTPSTSAGTSSTSDATPSIGTSLVPSATPSEAAAFLAKHSITIHTPPNVPGTIPVLSFNQLDIPADLRSSFEGFTEPTPIQACTWPPALQGRDVVGIAETGSGKTLAFGIPALSRLISKSKYSTSSKQSKASTVSVLVVAPTRELAIQTHDTLSALGAPFGIASVAVFGGVPKEPQVRMLKNANKGKDGLTTRIIVGTPGRILDLMQEGVCDLSGVDYLVLDEADRMLDKGFENDIRNIISSTKPATERQTMMFSATWPEAVRRLASTFQQNPTRVTVGSDDLTANSRVEQSVEVFDDSRSKDSRLLALLRSLSHKKTTTTGASDARILIFALYKKEASRVEDMLRRQGYSVGALHGDMTQNARMDTLEKFKNGTTGLMVATDVAARGLDIPNVGAVINYTFPLTIEDYIHRIGRTGRGGRSGKSITFFTGDLHERSLAGELARVLREGGFDYEGLKKFPMTIKKKEHSAYGAFFRDDIPVPKGPTKIVF
ncbi:P-loop containing nucleoside triphosphate hydrolase protein [Collybia nuda]|uniref:RNA helicase n=1 Tax=Collybia nuda TaxID=64659 RepID=A0A9P5XXF6_9AGAR|nr:P-loop containing nucleoside triphosphate hydrolase protein [Collybia nuda]